MSDPNLIIRISASAKQFDDELEKLKKKTESLEDKLKDAAKISAAAFVVLTGTIAGAVSKAEAFEKTFSNVVTQLDKSSFSAKTLDKGIEDLKKGVIALGISSGQSFESLNTGLFEIVSAGIPAEKALEALGAASELAVAGATDTASAVKALIAAMTSYGDAAGSAQEIAQAFFTASKYGVTDVAGLATQFNKVAGLANTLGISFNEALASATALTNNGATPVAQAFTQFDAVLNSVILAQGKLKLESKAVQDAMSLENVQAVGLNEALRQTMEATGGNVVVMQRLLGSSNALSAVMSLTGKQAADVDKIFGALNDTQGQSASFAAALKTKQETLDQGLQRLYRSVEAAAIILGDKFLPVINEAAGFIGSLAKKFSELDPFVVKMVAGFLTFATALTGIIAGATTAAIAFINIKNALAALNIVFGVGRIAAIGFWGAATGGIALLLAALPGLITYVGELVDRFKGMGQAPKDLKDINSELERMKALREKISSGTDINFGDQKDGQLAKVDEKIAALERLKKKELEVQAVQNGAAPGSTAPAADNTPKPVIQDDDTKKRIAAAEAEAVKLKQIRDQVSTEEQEFEARRAEIKQATYEANKITDDQERALALSNLQQKNENLLTEEANYQIRRAEEVANARAAQDVVNKELDAMDAEYRAGLKQKDIDDLTAQVMTEDQIRAEAAKGKLKKRVEEHNTFLKDQVKFGTAYATINQVLHSEEFAMASQAANALVGMQQSKNGTLKTIGKAAALTQLSMSTAVTAMEAYQAMASIPYVGPALGAAAAGSVIAYGAERASTILQANQGGMVPNVAGAVRGTDSVSASLTPGEFVVPAESADEVINAAAAARADGSSEGGGGSSITIMGDFFGEESFIDKLAEKLFDAQRTRNVRLV